jgi:hypothetical protein
MGIFPVLVDMVDDQPSRRPVQRGQTRKTRNLGPPSAQVENSDQENVRKSPSDGPLSLPLPFAADKKDTFYAGKVPTVGAAGPFARWSEEMT